MRALTFVYIIEDVAHSTRAEHNSWVAHVKIWPRSCVQATERDQLFVYPVIDIHGSALVQGGTLSKA